uniref:Uncharacterized protein n=1 Tax=Nelumbo nucifera TaxID=4432 RepID=A0A822YBQ9_NELNU|nr:TPA_asm: hypothetical protein HUJ06_029913 [Nelumbo nucifera]
MAIMKKLYSVRLLESPAVQTVFLSSSNKLFIIVVLDHGLSFSQIQQLSMPAQAWAK